MTSAPASKRSYVLNETARILVVDDDPIFREFALVHLATPAAAIETAADGVEAWEQLRSGPFDLAMLDIDMPGCNGFELLELIRDDAGLRYLPVVMVTGREDISSIDQAFALGATSFVTKPVNWRQMSYQLRYVLRMSKIESETRAGRDRAEHASALKSNLLSVLRHELRTPLNSIIGFANLMAKASDDVLNPKYREYAAIIEGSGQRLLDAHIEMLNYAQLVSGEYQLREDEHAVARIVAAAVKSVDEKVGRVAIEAQIDSSCDGAYLTCDRQQVESMLRHLLENAVVHGGGGQMSAATDASGNLLLEISDAGPGIDTQQLQTYLAPFSQVDMSHSRKAEGLGLGLPIASRIAELHGGSLHIGNARPRGTRVAVRLPASRLLLGIGDQDRGCNSEP